MPTGVYIRTEEHKRSLRENNSRYWLGKKMSNKTKKKISEAKMGNPGGMLNKHHSEKSRNKMSESRRGLKQSIETVAKRVAKNTGKKRTKEQKKE